jgi:O-antigen ligase
LVFLALLLWAAGCVQQGILQIAWSPFYWPFLALLLLAVVQLLAGFTVDHVATREAVLKLITDFVLFFLAGQLLHAEPESRRILGRFGLVATLLALAVSAFALAQFFFTQNTHLMYWSLPVPTRPFGPYVNPNNYGGLMELLIPLSVGYILPQSSHWLSRLLLWGAVIVALVSVWVSSSRGASAAMLIEGLVFGIIFIGVRPKSAWRRVIPVVAGVAVASACIFTWMVNTGGVSSRAWSIFSVDQPREVKLGDRIWVSKTALRMTAHNPGLGIGVGCFEFMFPSYAMAPTDLYWDHAHDDFAEGLAETGLTGGVILVVALWLFFRLAFRDLADRLERESGWIQLGAVVGCLGLMAHSLVDFNLRIPANAAWFVVCLAIAVHARWSHRRFWMPAAVSKAGTDRGPLLREY